MADQHCDVVLVGDSIIKYVGFIWNTLVISYPGISILKLIEMIRSNDIDLMCDLHGKQLIVFHVGTNDYDDGHTVPTIVTRLRALSSLVKRKFPGAIIAINDIIPRYSGWPQNQITLNKINREVMLNSGVWEVETIPSTNTFLHYGQLPSGYFSKHDQLHLKPAGFNRLRLFLIKHIVKLRCKYGFPLEEGKKFFFPTSIRRVHTKTVL